MLGGGRGKGGVNFLGRGRLNYQQSDAQMAGYAGRLLSCYQPVHLVARVDQQRNFRGTSNHVLKDLYALRKEIVRYHGRKTGDVAAWAREALNKAKANRIGHRKEYNRDGGSCRFQSYRCLRAGANEQIGFEGDKFGRESRDALGIALEISVVNDHVLALDPTVIAQALLPHFEE